MCSIPAFEDILLPYLHSSGDPLSTPLATSHTIHPSQQTNGEKSSDHDFIAGQLTASPFGAFYASVENFSSNTDFQLDDVEAPTFLTEFVKASHDYVIPKESYQAAEEYNLTKQEQSNNDLGKQLKSLKENIGFHADSITHKNDHQASFGFSSHLNTSTVSCTPVTMSLLSDVAPSPSDFAAVTDTFIDRSQTSRSFTKLFESSLDTNNLPSIHTRPPVQNNFVSTVASTGTNGSFESNTNASQKEKVSEKPATKQGEPLSYTEKIAERRRRNRESSSKCYYNRKRIKDHLDAEISSQKCRLMQLYDKALELRHENARLKRAVVTSGISLPIQKKSGRVNRRLKL